MNFSSYASSSVVLGLALTAFAAAPASAHDFARNNPSLLYVADNAANAVFVFNAQTLNAMPLSSISKGVNGPTSLAVDKQGMLYVGNAGDGSISVYKSGATAPARSISLSGAGTPQALTVGENDALVAGYNDAQHGSATLVVFTKGALQPSRTIAIPLGNNSSVSIDAVAMRAGWIYASVTRSPNGPAQLLKFAPGSSNGIDTGMMPGNGQAFDPRDNFYDSDGAMVSVYGGKGQVEYQITQGLINGGQLAVAQNGELFFPNGSYLVCGRFKEPGYVTVFNAGSQNPNNYLVSSVFQNPVAVAVR